MKQTAAFLRNAGPAIARDAVGLAGASAIVAGTAMVTNGGVAIIIAGCFLLATAVLLARRG